MPIAHPQVEKFIRAYSQGDIVFTENSDAKDMFIVYSGKVNLYKQGRGSWVPIGTVEEGDFFGEMAIIDGSPRSATATASENTRLIVLDRPRFLYLIRHQPAFALLVMQRLCDRVRHATSGWVEGGKSDDQAE